MNIETNLMAVKIDPTVVITAIVIALALTVVLGALLAIASKFLQVEQDNRIEKITELLPGYNCGACGKAGCAAFAAAIVAGEVPAISGCKVIKPEAKQKLKEYIDNAPGPDGSIIKINL